MSGPNEPYGATPGGGGYGEPPQPNPYEQPQPYSQPLQPQPYSQPLQPQPYSQPLQPQPYSQPLQPNPYGQPGQPTPTWTAGPPTMPGAPVATMSPPTPPKKSLRWLWITLGVIAALLVVVGGGGAFALSQYLAPATAAVSFCSDLKAQNYTAAYGLLSSNLKSQLTQDTFVQGSGELDTAEGKVTACGQASGSNVYTYSLGSSTAEVKASITRSTAGALEGVVHLKNENGSWKVDGLDTSLLGVSLGALQAAGAFCAAMQTQNYSAAYALLGAQAQAVVKQADFTQASTAHDAIDGPVNACGLAMLGPGNTDTSASLVVSITRSKLGAKQGALNLDVESGLWKIANIAPEIQGSNLDPLLVANQFCIDLVTGKYADAYSLLSAHQHTLATEAQFASSIALPSPLKWSGCTPDYSTYTVSTTSASFKAALKFTDTANGQSASVNFKLSFVQEGGSWKLDDIASA
jgi:hypothetical protein